jgi:predicted nucleic acid-binding protein
MILDTSALSDFLREDPSIRRYVTEARVLCLPVIVLGEYLYGLKASQHRTRLEQKVQSLLDDVSVLIVEEDTAGHYADIRHELKKAGTPIPENDIWIAALVRQHHLALLSRDKHFDSVEGLHRISW